ncbi:MAG TPA: hypothetical protein VL572_00875 [Pyrinomonadaceae bacterium]|nr:hypothetical protein [Pyrinomonadaceae bacterium]
MRKGKLNLALTVVAVLAGFGAVYGLTNFIERNRVSVPEDYYDSDLTLEGKRLKGFALGSEGLLADWYWMRSLQYIGGKLAQSELEHIDVENLTFLKPRLLYPMLDNATDLDPQMMAAYTYGAMVLPAIDPQQAITLTHKAIANNPESWRMYQYLGYIHWRLKDYEKATQAYDKGSQIAGSPNFMRMMAANLRTKGGSRETARAMYQQMLDEAQDLQAVSNATFRLNEIDSLNERDVLNAELKRSLESLGRCPNSLIEIVPRLRNVKLPAGREFRADAAGNIVDPSGAPYLLDRDECEAKIDTASSTIPPVSN